MMQFNNFNKVTFAHTFIKIFGRSFCNVVQTYSHVAFFDKNGNKIDGLSEND